MSNREYRRVELDKLMLISIRRFDEPRHAAASLVTTGRAADFKMILTAGTADSIDKKADGPAALIFFDR